MAQTDYQGMGLYPPQEDRPPEGFHEGMNKRMGLLQLGTGEIPMLRGTKEGVGLYAGGGGTELVYSGETGQPYYVASSQPAAAPTTPETPLGTAEWVEQGFKKKKEAYAEALKNQRSIIEKGKELGLPLEKVEAALKAKNLLKLKEPELSAPMLNILEEEKKAKAKVEEKAKEAEGLGYGDKELIKKTLVEMPKLKREAVVAQNISTQIDTARDLIKTGVTGKGGQFKSFLAPYAEMAGVNTDNMSDSQKFQLLTRAIIGPMRLEIVGPGPVSEWEQKLMQQISGGGGATKEAASELLGHWQKLAQSKIDNYNDTLSGFSEVYPNVQKVYQPLTTGKEEIKKEETQLQSDMPVPSQHKGRTIQDDITGKKYRSDGQNWVEVE